MRVVNLVLQFQPWTQRSLATENLRLDDEIVQARGANRLLLGGLSARRTEQRR